MNKFLNVALFTTLAIITIIEISVVIMNVIYSLDINTVILLILIALFIFGGLLILITINLNKLILL